MVYCGMEYNPEKPYQIIGNSDLIKNLLRTIGKIAPFDSTVLIGGEKGTGKALVAQEIYNLSKRSSQPMECLHCGVLQSGVMESTLFGYVKGAFTGAAQPQKGYIDTLDKGTLIIDEISLATKDLQAALLRFLEEGEYTPVGGTSTKKSHVRIIVTTNENLEAMVKNGKFRGDLLDRFNVLPITIPPLRKRMEDLSVLAHYFVDKHSKLKNNFELTKKYPEGIPGEWMNYLSGLKYPGNVRELENLMERSVVWSDFKHLPDSITNGFTDALVGADGGLVTLNLYELEKRAIHQALEATNGNRTQASKLLGVSVRTVRNKLHEYEEEDGKSLFSKS